MPEVEPITREEMLLDGQDLEPITRKEMFIKRIYDKTQVVPEPITREEMFLKKAGDETTDVTIEQLNVSANGTYSESGKAYSPVIVNVPAPPIPDNAYLLNEVEGLPSDIATFTDGSALPMPSLKVAIEPQQDLHGYDSPWVGGAGKNKFDVDLPHEEVSGSATYSYIVTVKPNTNYTMSCNVPQDSPASLYFNGTATNVNGVWNGNSRTFTSDANGQFAVYVRFNTTQGGIDLYTAVKNGTYYIQLEEGSTATTYSPYSNICPISGWDEVDLTVADDVENPTVSNVYTIDLDGTRYGGDLDVINGIGREYKEYPSYNGETLIGPWISDRDAYAEGTTPTIGAQVVDKGDISTFNTIPTAVKSLRGVNNVYANTGDIKDAEYFSKEV